MVGRVKGLTLPSPLLYDLPHQFPRRAGPLASTTRSRRDDRETDELIADLKKQVRSFKKQNDHLKSRVQA